MRMSWIVVVAALTLLPQTLQAQVYWVPGLDIVVPAYVTLDEKTAGPGPLVDRVGYDRDTQVASRLDLQAHCYTTWAWAPTPGHGAITHLIQIGPRQWALYHESGLIRVDTESDALYCRPL